MPSISRLAPPDPHWALGAPAPAVDEDQTAWLVTFSDLVLQLFAFVLVAVVLGNGHRPPAAVPAPPAAPVEVVVPAAPVPPPAHEAVVSPVAHEAVVPPMPDPAAARATALGGYLRELARAAGRPEAVGVTVRDADVVLTLNDTITFPSGSADLLPDALPILAAIRTLVGSLPEFAIQVEGHTDDAQIHTAAFPSNLELSLARAARVARELGAGDPALAARAAASGFGEHRPIASNGDEAGRARNRRVEIRLVRRDPPA